MILIVLHIFKPCYFVDGFSKLWRRFPKREATVFAVSQDHSEYIEVDVNDSGEVIQYPNSKDGSSGGSSTIHYEGSDGKPGFVSFYNRPYKREDGTSANVKTGQSSLAWLAGPAVLVASFIFPSLYLRKILSTIFEDSLLTG